MTEAEWVKCGDPDRMFRHARHYHPDERKCRLFATHCCRRIWDRLTDARCRAALKVCELYTEGEASAAELATAEAAANAVFVEFDDRDGLETAASAVTAACAIEDVPTLAGQAARETAALAGSPIQRRVERKWQSRLLRDLFGPLPFRPVVAHPTWLTSTVLMLAGQMYASREFGAMPILADALQDAGCDSDDILNHCRDTTVPHARVCWAVDLLLGKR